MMHGTRLFAMLALTAMVGCNTTNDRRLQPIYTMYNQGDYQAAYVQASSIAAGVPGRPAMEAAYMAGMSAHRLGNNSAAEHYLTYATQSPDRKLAADARAALGVVYLQQGKYAQAQAMLLAAGRELDGPDKAYAFLHAAQAQQRQGQWSQARATLAMARGASDDDELRQRISHELARTGYTIQSGAFAKSDNAHKDAQRIAAQASAAGLGPPRVVPAVDAQGRALYLVQVGHFSTFDSAAAVRRNLRMTWAIIAPMVNR